MNEVVRKMIEEYQSNNYSSPQTKHWVAYNYLKKYGVGHENEVSRDTMREVLGIKGNGTQYVMQFLSRSYRFDLYICSDNGGYWIPKNQEDTNFAFKVSRALTEIATCLMCGALTKKDAHAFIESIVEDDRVSGQGKIQFNRETNFVKRYGEDLENYEEWTYDKVYSYYKEVGGYPMKGLSKDEYIAEIRRINNEPKKKEDK